LLKVHVNPPQVRFDNRLSDFAARRPESTSVTSGNTFCRMVEIHVIRPVKDNSSH
jgi:hypothetical protein